MLYRISLIILRGRRFLKRGKCFDDDDLRDDDFQNEKRKRGERIGDFGG